MNLPQPPPQDDDPIITQFRPQGNQWELNDQNIKRIDPENGQTILHNYCHYINTTPLQVYQYLIETKGCDVNAQDNNKDTPLIYSLCCFQHGDITVLTYLLSQKGVNVNIKSNSGYTLLHDACEKINILPIEVFRVLIETHGADVNIQSAYKSTPIHCAIDSFNPNYGGNITALTYLLTQKDINVNIKGSSGYTLLHYACEKINILPLDIFKVLIKTLGCDVNAQDNSKHTPLHHALRLFDPNDGGDITALTYLINQKNANVNIKSKSGYNLLDRACININKLPLEIFKLLIETMGCDVNAQDNYKDTPLHHALRNFDPNYGGDITVLTYLLTLNNVNANIKGESGNSLLHYACFNINSLSLDIFEVLIETMGCDVNVQDENKDTPIHLAFLHFNSYNDCSKTILTYLLSHKSINFNIHGKNDRNLLHWACICGTAPDSDDDYSSDDDLDDSDDDLSDFDDSNNSVKAKGDIALCQIVEVIVETCLEQILDEIRF
jgi:ankyrin repeat protein